MNPNLAAARSVAGVSFLANAFAYTVSGSTLTVGTSGISNSATNTETFSNTIRPSINQTWTTAASGTTVLNGTTDINGTSAASRSLTVSGAGTWTFNGPVTNSFAGSTGNFNYSGTGILNLANTNSYTGNTTISGAGGTVNATKDGAFSNANISLTGGNITLTLSGGATNNYIGNSAGLNIGFTTDVVNLNYSGTDTIGTLTVNGVAQAPGVYGSAASGAPNVLPEFNGTGTLTVAVPEPTTSMLLAVGVLVGAQRLIRRKRS